ncbi:MAG: hypothetical protein LBU79_07420 [Planctomycetota bacterium]|jgi:hypothetical protein|nr:hypothetical protein [Planctomycetota bacterium]
MRKDRLPIKMSQPHQNDTRRTKGVGRQIIPPWVLQGEDLFLRAEKLAADFATVTPLIEKMLTTQSIIPVVFKAKICEDATANSRRHDIVSLFQFPQKNNIIGLYGDTELLVKICDTADANEVGDRLRRPEAFPRAISCLEKLSPFTPYVAINEEKTNVKVRLINFNDHDLDTAIAENFELYLRRHRIAFKKTRYSEYLHIYKLHGFSLAALQTIERDDIFSAFYSVEPMPRYKLSQDIVQVEDSVFYDAFRS